MFQALAGSKTAWKKNISSSDVIGRGRWEGATSRGTARQPRPQPVEFDPTPSSKTSSWLQILRVLQTNANTPAILQWFQRCLCRWSLFNIFQTIVCPLWNFCLSSWSFATNFKVLILNLLWCQNYRACLVNMRWHLWGGEGHRFRT